MRKPFNCFGCGKLVQPESAHSACRRTCGNPDCQGVLTKEHQKNKDLRRQNQRIEQLKQQGVEIVTCAVCHQSFEMIGYNHLKTHGLTIKEYDILYPDSPRLNSRIKQQRGKESKKRSHYLRYNGKKLDSKLYEFLTGALLGDGCLERSSKKRNARYTEGGSNQAYLFWKYEFLSQYFPCSFVERLSCPHPKTGKLYQGWWLRTKVHPILTEIYPKWYQNKKIISQELILQYLTEFALIIWFCDDGCSSDAVQFSTMAFSEEEVNFLMNLLKTRFGLQGSLLKNKQNQPLIRLNAESKRKFRDIASRYSIAGMEYKLRF